MKSIIVILIGLFIYTESLAAPSSQFGSVTLGWSYDFAANPTVTSFNIYYGTNATVFANWDGNTNQCQCYQVFVNTGSTGLTATINNLARGYTYYFNLTPVSGSEEGPYCNEVRQAIATKPGKASNLTIIGTQ